MSMFYLNLIITHVFITAVQTSMTSEKFRRLGSFSTVDGALVYLGPNPEMHNTQYVAECAVICVTNSCKLFLHHRSTSLCLLSSRQLHNSSASLGSVAQQNREQYNLYKIYVKEGDKYPLECPDGIVSLGMESREIPDSAITVSGETTHGFTKNNSRIGAEGGWSTPDIRGSTNHHHWISIALNSPAIIHQVATEDATLGCGWCDVMYVEQYSVQYSDDGVNWATYQNNGTKKIFNGNNPALSNGTVYQNFTPPIVTAHFKLYTEKVSLIKVFGLPSAVGGLRMDLYGCYL